MLKETKLLSQNATPGKHPTNFGPVAHDNSTAKSLYERYDNQYVRRRLNTNKTTYIKISESEVVR